MRQAWEIIAGVLSVRQASNSSLILEARLNHPSLRVNEQAPQQERRATAVINPKQPETPIDTKMVRHRLIYTRQRIPYSRKNMQRRTPIKTNRQLVPSKQPSPFVTTEAVRTTSRWFANERRQNILLAPEHN